MLQEDNFYRWKEHSFSIIKISFFKRTQDIFEQIEIEQTKNRSYFCGFKQFVIDVHKNPNQQILVPN